MNRNSLLLASLLAVLPAAGCNQQPAAAPAPAPPAGAKVSIIKPEMRPVRRAVEQPGTVQAFEVTEILAKIPGYIGSIAADPDKKDRPEYDRLIDIGSRVKDGQILAVLDVPELEKEWEQKIALVKQAEAEVVQAEQSLLAATAAIESAKASSKEATAGVARYTVEVERWRTELNQADELLSQKLIDTQSRAVILKQFEVAQAAKTEATARVESAEAAVKKAEADHGKSAADVLAAKARLEVAKAEVARVDALRGYTKIKAPFDGVVTRRSASTGDFVSPGDRTVLFRVARIDPVRVVVSIPEADAGLVNPGQDVKLTLHNNERTGKVVRTSWALEQGSRTLRTEIDLPNKDGDIRPQMYVHARLTAELPAAWAVPVAAVGKVEGEPVVYLVENGKAVRVAVQLLRGDAQFTQVQKYKKPGASDWTNFSGAESIAAPAAAVNDGQPVP
jgi:multidrug efflux pump subunit AcrA (membrane-fusion protein)